MGGGFGGPPESGDAGFGVGAGGEVVGGVVELAAGGGGVGDGLAAVVAFVAGGAGDEVVVPFAVGAGGVVGVPFHAGPGVVVAFAGEFVGLGVLAVGAAEVEVALVGGLPFEVEVVAGFAGLGDDEGFGVPGVGGGAGFGLGDEAGAAGEPGFVDDEVAFGEGLDVVFVEAADHDGHEGEEDLVALEGEAAAVGEEFGDAGGAFEAAGDEAFVHVFAGEVVVLE